MPTIPLIFCKLDESNLGYLRRIIVLFEAMSGPRVNVSKSALIPIGVMPNVNILAHFFGLVDYLPSSYRAFLWELLIRVNQFGTLLLRGSIRDWLVENLSFCLERVG